MLTDVPRSLIGFLKQYDTYYILGHEEPDGDCLGSQKAMASLLNRTGKTAILCSPGPFIRPEIKEIEHIFAASFSEAAARAAGKADTGSGKTGTEAVVILDCSTPERIGKEFAAGLSGFPVAVIDHHASGKPFGDTSFINGGSPSTTILVYQLMKELGENPTEEEAEDLLFGFLTDTGYFRHLDASNSDSMKLAAELLGYGASLKELYYRMYGGRRLESRILTGRILSRAESLFNGGCVRIFETLEEKHTFGAENRDSDTIYNQLLSVKGCEAVIFIREENEDLCSVSLRSLNDIDVGSVAESFGGGGHRCAAGFEWHGSKEEISDKLTDVFSGIFKAL